MWPRPHYAQVLPEQRAVQEAGANLEEARRVLRRARAVEAAYLQSMTMAVDFHHPSLFEKNRNMP